MTSWTESEEPKNLGPISEEGYERLKELLLQQSIGPDWLAEVRFLSIQLVNSVERVRKQ